MKEIYGDLIELAKQGEFDVIIHGCNCFCTMGAGIAAQIKRELRLAYEVDCLTKPGDSSKLGTVSVGKYKKLDVVNAYTQYSYSRNKNQADYDAIRSCMRIVKQRYTGKRIGMSLIGCGLAGGSWSEVSKIIAEELMGEDVTIVRLK